jgi:nucleoid-associated protein YgaU
MTLDPTTRSGVLERQGGLSGMARETKVGLLAGLAFIVCFAVILANRGRNGPPGLSDSVLTDASAAVPTSVRRSAAPRSDDLGHARNPRGASPADGRRAASSSQPARPPANHSSNGAPTRLADSTPASGAELPAERSVVESPARMTPRPAVNADAYPVGGGAADPNREALERVLTSRTPSTPPTPSDRSAPSVNPISNPPPVVTGQPISNKPQSEARPADVPVDPSARHSAVMSNERSAARGTEYRVQPSDTLSSIGAAHYGTKSKNAVNAIFDANRNVLADPDHLKVGMTLHIPTPATGDQGAAKKLIAPEPTKSIENPTRLVDLVDNRTAAGSAPTAESAAFRWYQVKKNDRYASIAREQLGDTGRWKEVYDLNKDKFPDPQRIREGVRIKLPGTAPRSDDLGRPPPRSGDLGHPPRRDAVSQRTERGGGH